MARDYKEIMNKASCLSLVSNIDYLLNCTTSNHYNSHTLL